MIATALDIVAVLLLAVILVVTVGMAIGFYAFFHTPSSPRPRYRRKGPNW